MDKVNLDGLIQREDLDIKNKKKKILICRVKILFLYQI